MSINYTDAILDAVQISVNATVDKLKFDKTYQGTIIKVNDLNTGEYVVRLQDGEFFAYSLDLDKEYRVNEEVYIKVPQGDMNQRKIIEGKVKNIKMSAAELDQYRNNVEQFGPDWGVWYNFEKSRYGVVAKPTRDSCEIFHDNGEENNLVKAYSAQAEYIRIKANFITHFYSSHTKGNYGLEIEFRTRNNSFQTVRFDIDDFNGNPYNFIDAATQEIIIPIRKNSITGLKSITLFQENFKKDMRDDTEINTKNIFVENIQIAFVSITDLTSYDYYLTYEAPDGTVFSSSVSNLQIIPILLINGERANKDGCICNLYKRNYAITAEKENYSKEAGLGWELDQTIDKNSSEFLFNFEKKDCPWQKDYLMVMNYNGRSFRRELVLANADSSYTIDVEQNTNSQGECEIAVKATPNARLSYKWYIKYPSGEIIPQTTTSSTIVVGKYLLYDEVVFYCEIFLGTNKIGNIEWFLKSPTSQENFTVSFSGNKSFLYDANGEISSAYINQNQNIVANIIWAEGYNASDAIISWDYSSITDSSSMIRDPSGIETTFSFKLARRFDYSKNNNTVFLSITLVNGASYKIPCPIEFLKTGDPGTNGTSFTCSIVPNSTNIWETSGSNNNVGLKAEVYKNGEKQSTGITYKWSGVNVSLSNSNSNPVIISSITSGKQYYYVKLEATISGFTTLYSFYPIDILSNGSRGSIKVNLPNYVKYNTNGYYPVYSNVENITYNSEKPTNSPSFAPTDKYTEEATALTYNFPNGVSYKHTVINYIDTYGNEDINGWDGHSISLDGSSGGRTVLAPQIGAGTKDGSNRFTGIVMGKDSVQTKVGLYGYSGGINTFGLTAEGKAFFGSQESGRISIDGEKAIIYGGSTQGRKNSMTLTLSSPSSSSSFNPNTKAIDIRDGTGELGISAFSVDYTGKMIATNAEIKGIITADSGSIGGWTIDGSKLSGGNTTLNSYTGIISTYNLVANGGFIGGWTINETVLSSGNTTLNSYTGTISTSNLVANGGSIGGWSIDGSELSGGNTTLNSSDGITTNTLTIKRHWEEWNPYIGEYNKLEGRLGSLGMVEGSTLSNGIYQTTKNIGISGGSTYLDESNNWVTPSVVLESQHSIKLTCLQSVWIEGQGLYFNGNKIA